MVSIFFNRERIKFLSFKPFLKWRKTKIFRIFNKIGINLKRGKKEIY